MPTIKEGTTAIGEVLDTLGDRASIFDEMGAGVSGLMQGLGYKGGVAEGIKGLGDLIFGEVDPDGAADRIGGIFAKFEGYGRAIREFNEDLKNNPIAQFLGDIAGKGLKLTLAAGGIALVAGAITKLAGALAKITGITTAIGIMKAAGKISGILKDVPIPTVPGDGKNRPTPDDKPGSWGTGWKGLLAMFQMVDAVSGMPSTKEGVEELYRKNREGASGLNTWLDERITTPSEWFNNTVVPLQPSADDDGGRATSLDAYLDGPVRTTGGSPRTTGEMLSGLNKPVTLDSGTIGQLLQPTRGVQEVRVTNKQAPELRQTNNFYITEVSNAKDVAAAVMSDIGQASKAAVEAADTD